MVGAFLMPILRGDRMKTGNDVFGGLCPCWDIQVQMGP